MAKIKLFFGIILFSSLLLSPNTYGQTENSFDCKKLRDFSNTPILERLKSCAMDGHASAQFTLGEVYSNNSEGLRDPSLALLWYRAAANQGHAHAMVRLGGAFNVGFLGLEQDFEKAAELYLKAIEEDDHFMAYDLLGMLHQDTRWSGRDPTLAGKYLETSAQMGYGPSQARLYQLLEWGEGGMEKNLLRAYVWKLLYSNPTDDLTLKNRPPPPEGMTKGQIEEAISQALEAQKTIKMINGLECNSLDRNAEFSKLYSCAMLGDARMQYNLSDMLYNGSGIPRDRSLALVWLKRAAEQGMPYALKNMGILLRDGIGVKKNPELAAQYLKRADEMGLGWSKYKFEGFAPYKEEGSENNRASSAQDVPSEKQTAPKVRPNEGPSREATINWLNEYVNRYNVNRELSNYDFSIPCLMTYSVNNSPRKRSICFKVNNGSGKYIELTDGKSWHHIMITDERIKERIYKALQHLIKVDLELMALQKETEPF